MNVAIRHPRLQPQELPKDKPIAGIYRSPLESEAKDLEDSVHKDCL